MSETPLKVLFWGTYDLSKPRNRILLRGLREAGAALDECHEPIWERVRDKGVLKPGALLSHLLRAIWSYPRLILRFLQAPAPDVVLVGYLGQLDVLALWPFARLRGIPVVWDQFISLHDTVVEDRGKVSRRHPLAFLLYAWEWIACRAVDGILMDTDAHATHVRETFGLAPDRVQSVWVGAETEQFQERPIMGERRGGPLRALFYGQFIPLHGVDTIVRAAQMLVDEGVEFLLIGTGQEEARIREYLASARPSNVEWKTWVEYESLVQYIHRADVCLGIFGASGKASRVIPNKVFQIVSARRPLVTRDSPAIREMFRGDEAGLWLVPPGDPNALADILRTLARSRELLGRAPHAEVAQRVTPLAIGRNALTALRRAVERARHP
jgi:glycosyltransferase involved in cell wall biosynthesis